MATIEAPWVVNAAGVGALAVGRMVGVEHPILPRRGQVLATESCPGLVRTKISSASDIMAKQRALSSSGSGLGLGLSVTPTPAGNVLLGGTNEFVAQDVGTSQKGVQAIAENCCRVVPALRGTRIVRSWAGLRPVTPDGLPVLGHGGGPEGYLVQRATAATASAWRRPQGAT